MFTSTNRSPVSEIENVDCVENSLDAIAIAASDGEGGYVDVTALTPEDESALAAWLADARPVSFGNRVYRLGDAG